MALVERLHVIVPLHAHGVCQALVGGRCRQKMDVIAHQYVRVQRDAMLHEGAVQQTKEELTVDVVNEDGPLVHTALGYVIRLACQHQARLSRHGHSGL